MKLSGVEVISFDNSGRRVKFTFRSPYDGKVINGNKYNKYLKSINKSPYELILDINKLTTDQLPKCSVCHSNPVRIIGKRVNRIDILNPRLHDICNDPKCGNKGSVLKSIETRRLMIDSAGLNGIQRASILRINKLLNTIDENGKSRFSNNASRSANTRILKGNHPSQISGIIFFDNKYFKSKAELRVYSRYKRLLNKYYIRESFISYYDNKKYIADYSLINENHKLPDVIEVKSGNLFYCPRLGDKIKMINYNKFKSVLNLSKTILIIDDYKSSRKLHWIHSIDELNELFDIVL